MSIDSKVDKTKSEEELLKALKIKADLLGITYNPTIGFTKLKEKLDLFLSEKNEDEPETTSVGPNKGVATVEEAARRAIRCIVRDLDSSQQNDPTIVVNIGNKFFKIGAIVQKDVEQEVPAAIVEALKAKTMVQWVDEKHAITKRPTGNRVSRTTKRYNIEIL